MLGVGASPEGAGWPDVSESSETDGVLVQPSQEVVLGIETDRGLLVGSLVAGGYQVYAINPFASSRYRDRRATSSAKSDPGDARVLANLVRTDRHQHRPLAGDSNLTEAVQILARALIRVCLTNRQAYSEHHAWSARVEGCATDL